MKIILEFESIEEHNAYCELICGISNEGEEPLNSSQMSDTDPLHPVDKIVNQPIKSTPKLPLKPSQLQKLESIKTKSEKCRYLFNEIGWDKNQIAEFFGISPNAVTGNLNYAKNREAIP